MLALQEFLKKHPQDWQEILTAEPYCLKIKEKDNLVIFNYSQLTSDFSEPIVCESRGIILEKGTWSVVRLAFYKFFNLGEPHAAAIDWESATASEKLDGSLMSVYYYDDEWRVATSGNIDAKDAPLSNATFTTFKQLFDEAARNAGLDYSKLNKHYCYTFEMISPFQRIVLGYNETTLYHILTRDMHTLEEVDCDIGIRKPALYFLEDEEAYTDFVKTFGEDHEGIVVKDKYNNRVKIKTEHYFMLHYLTNKMVLTLRRTIDLIRKNDYEELLVYFPHYRPWVEKVKAKLAKAAQRNEEIKIEVAQLKQQFLTRKDFATWVDTNITKRERRLYMLAYEDRLDDWFNYDNEMKEELEICRVKQIISTYELDK